MENSPETFDLLETLSKNLAECVEKTKEALKVEIHNTTKACLDRFKTKHPKASEKRIAKVENRLKKREAKKLAAV
jgi:hypothetical protein